MSKISVKIKRKKSAKPARPMPVYLQIIYCRKVARIPPGTPPISPEMRRVIRLVPDYYLVKISSSK